jgi:hypothetical protein
MAGSSDLSSVSDQLQSLIEAFDRLSEGEQREFAAEVLRRTCSLQWPALDDETVDRLADESFVEYDTREAADGRG